MEKKDMTKSNWQLLFIGIGIMFVGLVAVALVGPNYHGIPALIASSLLLLGAITVFWSLATKFE